MSGSVNKVILIGNLGADPEIRLTKDGRRIANMRIATSERWTDKATGERKEKTEWHTVVIVNDGLAKVAEAYLKKGSSVYVDGSLQTRKWTDKSGADRYSTEVVIGMNGTLTMLDAPGSKQDAKQYGKPASNGNGGGKPASAATGKWRDDPSFNDEIPF